MKRTSTLALLILLSLGHLPVAVAQDNTPAKARDKDNAAPKTYTPINRDDDYDDRDNVVTVVKKKKPVNKVAFGIEAGPSTCYLWRSDATNDPVIGGRIGGFLYIPLAGKLYLQPGLYYVAYGGSQTVGTGRINTPFMATTYNVHAIEMPVSIGFRFGHKKARYKSYIGMGPYIARNLGGTVTFDDGVTLKNDLTIGSNVGENFNAFDYGIGLNVFTEWHCGLFVGARLQYGLANLAPHVQAIHSISDGFTVGYLFGKKSKIVTKRFRRMTEENDRYNDPRPMRDE